MADAPTTPTQIRFYPETDEETDPSLIQIEVWLDVELKRPALALTARDALKLGLWMANEAQLLLFPPARI